MPRSSSPVAVSPPRDPALQGGSPGGRSPDPTSPGRTPAACRRACPSSCGAAWRCCARPSSRRRAATRLGSGRFGSSPARFSNARTAPRWMGSPLCEAAHHRRLAIGQAVRRSPLSETAACSGFMQERANTWDGVAGRAISRPSASQTATCPVWIDSVQTAADHAGERHGAHGSQLRTRLGSSRYRRLSSSWSASNTLDDVGPRCLDTPAPPRPAARRLREVRVVDAVGSEMPGVGDQALDPAARQQHLLLGHPEDGFASRGRCGSSPARISANDRPTGPCPRRSRGPRAPPQDLGAALHQPAQQREVFALGQTLVAPRPEVLQGQGVDSLEVRRVADPIDAAVAGCCSLTAPILRPGLSRRRAAPSMGRPRPAARVVLEVQVVDGGVPVEPT